MTQNVIRHRPGERTGASHAGRWQSHRGLDGAGVLRPARRPSQGWREEMSVPLFHVDAFTDRPFAGNPAAVCLLPAWREDRWLQAVAREMNLSETAFLVKQEEPDRLPRGSRVRGSP